MTEIEAKYAVHEFELDEAAILRPRIGKYTWEKILEKEYKTSCASRSIEGIDSTQRQRTLHRRVKYFSDIACRDDIMLSIASMSCEHEDP